MEGEWSEVKVEQRAAEGTAKALRRERWERRQKRAAALRGPRKDPNREKRKRRERMARRAALNPKVLHTWTVRLAAKPVGAYETAETARTAEEAARKVLDRGGQELRAVLQVIDGQVRAMAWVSGIAEPVFDGLVDVEAPRKPEPSPEEVARAEEREARARARNSEKEAMRAAGFRAILFGNLAAFVTKQR